MPYPIPISKVSHLPQPLNMSPATFFFEKIKKS